MVSNSFLDLVSLEWREKVFTSLCKEEHQLGFFEWYFGRYFLVGSYPCLWLKGFCLYLWGFFVWAHEFVFSLWSLIVNVCNLYHWYWILLALPMDVGLELAESCQILLSCMDILFFCSCEWTLLAQLQSQHKYSIL